MVKEARQKASEWRGIAKVFGIWAAWFLTLGAVTERQDRVWLFIVGLVVCEFVLLTAVRRWRKWQDIVDAWETLERVAESPFMQRTTPEIQRALRALVALGNG